VIAHCETLPFLEVLPDVYGEERKDSERSKQIRDNDFELKKRAISIGAGLQLLCSASSW